MFNIWENNIYSTKKKLKEQSLRKVPRINTPKKIKYQVSLVVQGSGINEVSLFFDRYQTSNNFFLSLQQVSHKVLLHLCHVSKYRVATSLSVTVMTVSLFFFCNMTDKKLGLCLTRYFFLCLFVLKKLGKRQCLRDVFVLLSWQWTQNNTFFPTLFL